MLCGCVCWLGLLALSLTAAGQTEVVRPCCPQSCQDATALIPSLNYRVWQACLAAQTRWFVKWEWLSTSRLYNRIIKVRTLAKRPLEAT
jgi:hypothetical protein